MTKLMGERLLAVAMIAISIYVIFKANTMPQRSGTFPIFTAVGVILLSLGMLLRTVLVQEPRLSGRISVDLSYGAMKPYYVMAVAVAYSFSVFSLGFYVSSVIFYFIVTYMTGLRDHKVIFIVAVVLFPLTYVFFTVGLGAKMPPGILF